jgi:hypothetical protein
VTRRKLLRVVEIAELGAGSAASPGQVCAVIEVSVPLATATRPRHRGGTIKGGSDMRRAVAIAGVTILVSALGPMLASAAGAETAVAFQAQF